MLIIGIAIYLVISFLLTVLKIESNAEGLKFFFLSIILTPVYALVVNLKSKKISKMYYYYCKECGYVFPVKLKHCPVCEENGVKVKLLEYESPHNLESLYQKLPLT
ncbi:MAG: hypothetical protein IH595_06320 [Bacteroidales bacterium]|nr:hypothetical protein [Bacteroidales bacterium]